MFMQLKSTAEFIILQLIDHPFIAATQEKNYVLEHQKDIEFQAIVNREKEKSEKLSTCFAFQLVIAYFEGYNIHQYLVILASIQRYPC